ncbi:MAG: hypothetical protein HC886_13305 [Leptolyngbyaceae cyanobacterium SM1_1_3]|nr:hypothetical protein [Leptolyngbyaceae cyanobacterium SM1_1_3]NJM84839.1 hypothetical protein [Leptolyngbyaceae cyanobacterium RM2_2_21]NJN01654.1 hypothetical protein [Leptolyngbyaceae cyanobacterium RM1_1_2]NJO10570.1 hypothetical protein [Leptolyngbyaceae cyanobacterium SL_1_1]
MIELWKPVRIQQGIGYGARRAIAYSPLPIEIVRPRCQLLGQDDLDSLSSRALSVA